jgi:hypothetical protein
MIQYRAEYRYCRDCGGERLFEQFHTEGCPVPGDCPEWACVECGGALIIGFAVPGYITGNGVSRAA